MKKDILGLKELESIKLNWSFARPGLSTTMCCSTGTCDAPKIDSKKHRDVYTINGCADELHAADVKSIYGCLRS